MIGGMSAPLPTGSPAPAVASAPPRPTALSRTFAILGCLSFGAFVGSLIGLAVSGDPLYNIGWSIALTGFILSTTLIGVASTRARLAATGPATGPATAAAPRAVLNPASTAVPATGYIVNGERMSASPSGRVPALAPGARAAVNRAIVTVLVLVGAAGALVPAAPMIAWTAEDVAAGRPFDGRDMRTGRHLQDAVDALNAVSGGTLYTEVRFYDSYLIAEAPTTPGADTVDRFMWRYGRAFRDGPGVIQPDDRAELEADLFDVAEVDADRIPGLVADTRDGLDWQVDDVYPSIRRDPEGRVVIEISASNDYKNATFTYSPSGELLGRSGSGFD